MWSNIRMVEIAIDDKFRRRSPSLILLKFINNIQILINLIIKNKYKINTKINNNNIQQFVLHIVIYIAYIYFLK